MRSFPPPCPSRLSVLLAVVVLFFGTVATSEAINYLGDRASGCTTLGAGSTHVLTLNNGTSAGSTLVLIGFVSAGAAAGGTPVADTRANSWSLAHTYSASNGSRMFLYEAKVAAGKTHSAGDTVTISYASATGQTSCAVLSTFSGLRTPSSVDRTGGASGTSMAPSVSTSSTTTEASELLIAAFGFTQATGGAGISLPMQLLSGAFSSPFGLLPGYRILGSSGSYTASGTTNNMVNWGGILATLKADNTIFADGFENGTTNNWSATVL